MNESTIEDWQRAVVRLLFKLHQSLPTVGIPFACVCVANRIEDQRNSITDAELDEAIFTDERLRMIAEQQIEMAMALPSSIRHADVITGRDDYGRQG